MPDDHNNTFDLVGQEGRLVRSSRMIAEGETITEARKADIRRRADEYRKKHGIHQHQIAREIGCGNGTISQVLAGRYGTTKRGKKVLCDDTQYLRRLNNWMELDARRRNLIQNREFVETSVARDIIQVAEIVAETCKLGVCYGPSQLGKSFTLRSLEGSDRLGAPILFRVEESRKRPLPLCRHMCSKLNLKTRGTFDVLASRLEGHLDGTKRMLMFDEAERLTYQAIEWVRDVHDQTGCPVLFVGKPAIYQKLGFREMDNYREVTDQLASRVVIRRDLTARTRVDPANPQPLFTRDDIRKLIQVANLDIKVSTDGVQWLHDRACTLGMGGIGMAKILLYLAYKYAVATGATTITAELLDKIDELRVEPEDVERIETIVHDPQSKRIRRLA
jgi:DNA transposition AAA+ family ATPase